MVIWILWFIHEGEIKENMSRWGNVPHAITFNDKKKKKYKFLSLRGILHISAKLHGGICKTSCWLTEVFDTWDKLINVVQFQGVIEVLLMSGGYWQNLQFQR